MKTKNQPSTPTSTPTPIRPQFPILQVPFHGLTYQAVLDTMLAFLKTNKNHLVVTPNPEALMLAQRDKGFLHILQNADLVLPDGIGIILAARWKKLPISERVPGCDITTSLLEAAKGHTCYLLGAAPGVAEAARDNLKQKGITVIGVHDGYFDSTNEEIILNEIQQLSPDILLVGMGMPRQEEWSAKHLHKLPCKITLCVGGTIDVLAANVKRAPKIMRRFGLEWLFRLVTNPSRMRRMCDIPRFVWAVCTDPKRMFLL